MPAPEHVHADRRDRLRAMLGADEPGRTLLVTSLPNVEYLTGFSGSNAVVAIGPDPAEDRIGTDGRYVDQVAAESPGLPTLIDRDTLRAIVVALGDRPLAVEGSLSIADLVTVRTNGREPVMVLPLVETLRSVKDEHEQGFLARACAITAQAFEALADEMRPGQSERTLARRLEQLFGEFGADDRSFETIVGSGPNSAIPHHQPGERRLEVGDLVVVDAGALVAGYHADMTRTYVVGTEPEEWQAEIHGLVEDAQAAATAAYVPLARTPEVDAAARSRVEAAGFGERFDHGLGHGVGLQIHEAPMIGPRSTGTLVADMVITVEPGVYLPGRGGVRIEDTLVVTDAGPRILTEAPRGLRVVG